MIALLFFLFIPVSSVGLCFLKDNNKDRKLILNVLLILNGVFFIFPLIYASFNTAPGESMWNENTGGGAAIWLYFIVFPMSIIIQVILAILKIIYSSK